MKRFIIAFLFICAFSFVFCDDLNAETAFQNDFANKTIILQTSITFPISFDANSKTLPITYEFGSAFQIPLADFSASNAKLLFNPELSFFMNYYKVNASGVAVFSELEKRMATVPSLMINAPFAYNKLFNNSSLQISLGLAFLFRFGFKSTSAVTNGDLSKINESFYKSLSFFYPNIGVSYDIGVGKSTIGFGAKAFFPAGNLFAKNSVNTTRLCLVFRFGL